MFRLDTARFFASWTDGDADLLDALLTLEGYAFTTKGVAVRLVSPVGWLWCRRVERKRPRLERPKRCSATAHVWVAQGTGRPACTKCGAFKKGRPKA